MGIRVNFTLTIFCHYFKKSLKLKWNESNNKNTKHAKITFKKYGDT